MNQLRLEGGRVAIAGTFSVIDGMLVVTQSGPGNHIPPFVSSLTAASHGVLVRLRDAVPEFIQTSATDPARSKTSYFEGMVADNEGATFVGVEVTL